MIIIGRLRLVLQFLLILWVGNLLNKDLDQLVNLFLVVMLKLLIQLLVNSVKQDR